MTEIVKSGYRSRKRQEWTDVLTIEALRDQHRRMASKYSRLRAAVLLWAEARGKDAEGGHLHALLREVGRWPEDDTRTQEERAMDELDFVGAHRRMGGR